MVKVFMPCSGLGNVRRGFESFTQECFEALSQEHSFDVTLFKGGGDSLSREITLWNFPRESWMAIQLGKLIGGVTRKGEEPGKVIGREKLAEGHQPSKSYMRHRSVYDRFSWEKLRPHYVEMIQRCVASPEAEPLL